jgi:hypothetical protein
MTPHEERLLFRALAAILVLLSEDERMYPDRVLINELKSAAGSAPSFLGKGADHA